jgi:hypothetical protein
MRNERPDGFASGGGDGVVPVEQTTGSLPLLSRRQIKAFFNLKKKY